MNNKENNFEEVDRDFKEKWNECNCEGGFDIGQCSNEEDGHKFAFENIKEFIHEKLQQERERARGEGKILMAQFIKRDVEWLRKVITGNGHQDYNKAVKDAISVINKLQTNK